jgi:CubicO group peptidase (beta-lactamase class C family)
MKPQRWVCDAQVVMMPKIERPANAGTDKKQETCMTKKDFRPIQAAMQGWVDRQIVPGISQATLFAGELVDVSCAGWADVEKGEALREDHLFRVFSNTKLITSCAVMLLVEQKLLALTDPIEKFIPQLARRRVLRSGAQDLDDTEPAQGSITILHLLTHSSGLSYGFLDPGTVIYKAYTAREIISPQISLSEMIERLATLPLVFHPGTSFEYSIATDVLGRLVEIVSGQSLADFFRERIFQPLRMHDTFFRVPEAKQARMAAMYRGTSVLQPDLPGLKVAPAYPYMGAYRVAVPKASGGGGLVSSLPDMVCLLRSLLPAARAQGAPALLSDSTVALMMRNHLPAGVSVRFPIAGNVLGKGFGLGGAVSVSAGPLDPPNALGEFQWGGIGGTHWWISPKANLAGVLMTQRVMSFWNPFSFDIKRRVHALFD